MTSIWVNSANLCEFRQSRWIPLISVNSVNFGEFWLIPVNSVNFGEFRQFRWNLSTSVNWLNSVNQHKQQTVGLAAYRILCDFLIVILSYRRLPRALVITQYKTWQETRVGMVVGSLKNDRFPSRVVHFQENCPGKACYWLISSSWRSTAIEDSYRAVSSSFSDCIAPRVLLFPQFSSSWRTFFLNCFYFHVRVEMLRIVNTTSTIINGFHRAHGWIYSRRLLRVWNASVQ